MLGKFFALVVAFTLATSPTPKEEKEYLAVFGSQRLSSIGWQGKIVDIWREFYNPNLIMYSREFEDLDIFLLTIKDRAGDRPIVIDIECHGNSDGLLHLEDHDDGSDDAASVGYLIKKINQYLKDKNVKAVTLEACHSRYCMEVSLDPYIEIETPNFHVAKFNEPINFPVYGVGLMSNYNNFVYAQYESNNHFMFEDLREYRHKKVEQLRDLTAQEDEDIKAFYTCLFILKKLKIN